MGSTIAEKILGAHAGVIVPGLVVGLHVLEAEKIVVAQLLTRFRRAIEALGLAAVVIAKLAARPVRRAAIVL